MIFKLSLICEKLKPASLIVQGINIGDGEERAVLKRVRRKSVSGGVPEAAARHAHVLLHQLADADHHDDLIARDHQVLHSRLHHLQEQRIEDSRQLQ